MSKKDDIQYEGLGPSEAMQACGSETLVAVHMFWMAEPVPAPLNAIGLAKCYRIICD